MGIYRLFLEITLIFLYHFNPLKPRDKIKTSVILVGYRLVFLYMF